MNDKPTGGRPLPAWGWCGSSNASNSVHGTTTSIVSRNCSRLLFRPYFSKLPWDDNVICRIVLLIHVQLYPSWLWIPHLCRGFLVEQSMGEAMIAGDVDKLNQIYADDFAAISSSGTVITKQNFLSDHDKLEWFENGPIDVQVFGNLALAQGFVKEKRSQNGKDISVQFLWQDILRKRAGKWVVWRTTGARVDLVGSPRSQSQDPAVVDAFKQLEQNVGDAMIAGDVDKLNQIYAEDFAAVGSSGTVITKQSFLSDHDNLVSFENGPIYVQVLGDVAVVQTSVTEKRIQDGKDI